MCKKQIKKLQETDDMPFGVRMQHDSEKGYCHQMQRGRKQTLMIAQRSRELGMAEHPHPAMDPKQLMGYRMRC